MAVQSGHPEQFVGKKHSDPLATKQKWYCPSCGSGYKTKFGVIIEMVVNRKEFDFPEAEEDEEHFEIAKGVWSKEWMGLYCKADIMPQQFQDLKASCIEKYNPECTTPAQLLDAIPELRPIQRKALVPKRGKGQYMLTKEADDEMASANWDELFCICKQLNADEPPAASSTTTT